MGTNYYLTEGTCPHCGRGDERLHIGKSSAGWCFSLHVDPTIGINELADWQERWMKADAVIVDEYGEEIAPKDMLAEIMERGRSDEQWKDKPFGYPSWEVFHRMNHSERGPKGLLRHQVDGRHCLGHGAGTYDLISGDFS